jgi:hypothetical protein
LERGHGRGAFEDEEVLKFRDALTVLGYQLWSQSI